MTTVKLSSPFFAALAFLALVPAAAFLPLPAAGEAFFLPPFGVDVVDRADSLGERVDAFGERLVLFGDGVAVPARAEGASLAGGRLGGGRPESSAIFAAAAASDDANSSSSTESEAKSVTAPAVTIAG